MTSEEMWWTRSLCRRPGADDQGGAPDDLAAAVAYFASEEAGYVTGRTLAVSGGLTMA